MTEHAKRPATYADLEAVPPHLWHLDPRAKTLEVFQRPDKNWLLTHTSVDVEDVCAAPFDAITFSLGLLWPFDASSVEPTSNEQK
ncbi:MAG: hypothetical protein R3D68_02395 [Hyphomicrobiaceae bacterium]